MRWRRWCSDQIEESAKENQNLQQRQQRADSAPTGVTSGRTGIRAKAVVPLRARGRVHGPFPTFLSVFKGSGSCRPRQEERRLSGEDPFAGRPLTASAERRRF